MRDRNGCVVLARQLKEHGRTLNETETRVKEKNGAGMITTDAMLTRCVEKACPRRRDKGMLQSDLGAGVSLAMLPSQDARTGQHQHDTVCLPRQTYKVEGSKICLDATLGQVCISW